MWLPIDNIFGQREFFKFFIRKDNLVRTDQFSSTPILFHFVHLYITVRHLNAFLSAIKNRSTVSVLYYLSSAFKKLSSSNETFTYLAKNIVSLLRSTNSGSKLSTLLKQIRKPS